MTDSSRPAPNGRPGDSLAPLVHLIDEAVAEGDALDDALRALLAPSTASRSVAGWSVPDRYTHRRLARRPASTAQQRDISERCHTFASAVIKAAEMPTPDALADAELVPVPLIDEVRGLAGLVGDGRLVDWALPLHSRALGITGELRRGQIRLFLHAERSRQRIGGAAAPLPVVDHGSYRLSTDPSDVDLGVVHGFLSEHAYWARSRPRHVVERSVLGSFLTIVALDGEGRTVGFARVVSDGATFGWLADLFVLPDVRGQGLAGAMVQLAIEHPELATMKRMVLATADAHGLYERFGFETMPEPDRWMTRHGPGT